MIFLNGWEKVEKFGIFWGKFSKPRPKPNMADPTQPEQQKIDPIWHRSKMFDPDPSLGLVDVQLLLVLIHQQSQLTFLTGILLKSSVFEDQSIFHIVSAFQIKKPFWTLIIFYSKSHRKCWYMGLCSTIFPISLFNLMGKKKCPFELRPRQDWKWKWPYRMYVLCTDLQRDGWDKFDTKLDSRLLLSSSLPSYSVSK